MLSPYLTTWNDLGNWNTLLLNFGPDIGVDSGDVSMTYAFALTHSWRGPVLLKAEHGGDDDHGYGADHDHFPPGMSTVYLEMTGETEFDGDQRTFIELLPGVSYVLTEHAELRFGVSLPVSNPQRYEAQYFTSFTWVH